MQWSQLSSNKLLTC